MEQPIVPSQTRGEEQRRRPGLPTCARAAEFLALFAPAFVIASATHAGVEHLFAGGNPLRIGMNAVGAVLTTMLACALAARTHNFPPLVSRTCGEAVAKLYVGTVVGALILHAQGACLLRIFLSGNIWPFAAGVPLDELLPSPLRLLTFFCWGGMVATVTCLNLERPYLALLVHVATVSLPVVALAEGTLRWIPARHRMDFVLLYPACFLGAALATVSLVTLALWALSRLFVRRPLATRG